MTDAQLDTLVAVRGLTKHFAVAGRAGGQRRVVHAVDDVSFDIRHGETLALVGESGSGKTTLGRLLLRAADPDSGTITADFGQGPVDLAGMKPGPLRALRPHMQMIFQDPYMSLNPRLSVRDIIADPLLAMRLARGAEIDRRVVEVARRCQLSIEHLRRFPHAFSGGQRQRIGIARALVTAPQLVVCDEAVSALDVSIRAEILNLLNALKSEFGLTYLFISHDLGVVRNIADRVAVMYLGQIVELAPATSLFAAPRHPYTRALLSAVPAADPETPLRAVPLAGDVPDPTDPPPGCRFHTRCPIAQARCRSEAPRLAAEAGHAVACHFPHVPSSQTERPSP